MNKQLPILLGLSAAAFAGAFQIMETAAVVGVGGLGVNWTDTVKPNMDVSYTLRADAKVTYGCFNKGGKNPASANKRVTFNQVVSAMKMIQANASGAVTGHMSLGIPDVGSHLSCPPGQGSKLSAVTYSNVVLTNNRAATSHTFTGSFTKVFLALK